MAERFGLFIIIVLGEVVVGVADGLAEADGGARTVASGLVALGIGFGLWWNYFDFVGRRVPRPETGPRSIWLYGHFPLAMSIAATDAGMVSLIKHAGDGRTLANTAWLISAAAAASLAVVATTMTRHPGRRVVSYALLAQAPSRSRSRPCGPHHGFSRRRSISLCSPFGGSVHPPRPPRPPCRRDMTRLPAAMPGSLTPHSPPSPTPAPRRQPSATTPPSAHVRPRGPAATSHRVPAAVQVPHPAAAVSSPS